MVVWSNINSNLKRYAAYVSWTLFEKIFRLLVTLIVGIYVVRYLGPSRYGLLSYAASIVALFHFMTRLGLEGIVVRDIVNKIVANNVILGSSFILKFTGAILLFFSVLLFMFFSKSEAELFFLLLIVASGMVFDSFRVIEYFFQATQNFRYVTFAHSISILCASFFRLFCVFCKADLVWFAAAVLFEQFVLAFLLLFLCFKSRISIFSWRFKLSTAKQLLLTSWPLILSSFAIMLYMRIDQVMIKSFLNDEAVGNYAAAVKISELWYFLPIALSQALLPSIIELKKGDPDRYKRTLQQIYDVMVWVAVFISIPISLFSKPLTQFLYGMQYTESGGVLSIHIWSGIFVFLGVANGNWILAENLQIYSFYRTIIGSIINIFLNFLLLPIYGIKGAALATLISYSFASYFSMAFFKDSKANFILSSSSFNPIAVFKRITSLKTQKSCIKD